MRYTPSLLAAVAVGFSLAPISRPAFGGAVDVGSGTALSADVTAVLGDSTNPSAFKESHDTGSMTKPNVTAQATASVPVETSAFTGAGNSNATLTSSSDGFSMSGTSNASLTGASTLGADVRSSAEIDFPFTVANGFRATPKLGVTIDGTVFRDNKVSLVIQPSGGMPDVIADTFFKNFDDSLPTLGAGNYQLQVVTGSISTAKGVAGENGSASFQMSMSSSPVSSTAIPLPLSIWTGGSALAVAFIARRRIAAML